LVSGQKTQHLIIHIIPRKDEAEIFKNELTKSGQFVDVGNLSSGSYIFSVKGTKINKKFIKY
jgi:diadenosine tetraphosphate (Ap4A) HIT family hydrolase